jgi:hypothetical protein
MRGGKASETGALATDPTTERGVIMASLQQKHILLVEDDADTLSATTAMLERLGYSVTADTQLLSITH